MEDAQKMPKDIVIVILRCLSVRSLVRLRCVSKFWYATSQNPTFIDSHFAQQRRNGTVLMTRRYLAPPEEDDILSFYNLDSPKMEKVRTNLSVPFLKDLNYWPGNVQVLGPCNGIVCISYYECVIFCNPALREFRKLPPRPFICPKGFYSSHFAQGFGYTSTNNFKVVLIQSIHPDEYSPDRIYHTVFLYNSSTNSWRQFHDNAIEMPYISVSPSPQIFRGTCHWNVILNGLIITDIILTFNVNTEVFTQLEYPDYLKVSDNNFATLTTLNECLTLVRYKLHKAEPHLVTIWVMKEYGVKESWTQQFVLGPHVIVCPFLCWNNDNWLLLETSNGQFANCSLHTNEIKKLPVYGAEESLRALVYKESLISLNKVIKSVAVSTIEYNLNIVNYLLKRYLQIYKATSIS